ncbi:MULTISPECIES: M56 family metallopeptidase [Streptomyces]|uniref:M56 family metallopeptidase n=2 Tax=Streptomyces TaxID=1883 RepID=UPI000241B4F8|nr:MULTISPECIES: M56 family metallopeptidase [Streptomyces]EHM28157.1 M48 family peptidase [Streptomyces sp. W007]MCX4482936.1 M56 family metallopeptidase [Streptomyces anulatus]MCX4506108.1 M56 family metallopeptidase [Streptomyces anulatus]MCX4516616.1 M56 family metallopeptidase [Streptomyces anulatus]WSI75938.1 M56 family metallopeptidase [Streptomyces anulatus]
MGVFVYLPLVLPLTALPIARLAEQHLHPRRAARLLTTVAVILASCSLVCLGLLVVVGTAQLPGNPLPDGWSDAEVREAVPHDAFAGKASILALVVVTAACGFTVHRHYRFRARAHRALAGLPGGDVAVLPDDVPYAYALPGSPGRVMVSTALLASLEPAEHRALFAHERAHLAGRHHRLLLATRLAGCVNPLLWPLLGALVYSTERWADEEAARVTGDRRLTARAVGKAALVSRPVPGGAAFAAFAAAGPVPRRVAALLGPVPPDRGWPPALTPAGVAALVAAAGTTVSALSALNAAVALFLVLEAATPL